MNIKIVAVAIVAILIVAGASIMLLKNDEDNNSGEAWRTIVDAKGNTVVLEEQPERVVLLHSVYLEYFLVLDVIPAASAGASVGTAVEAIEKGEIFQEYRDDVNDMIDIGSARSINLESVLSAEPDVIVTFATHTGIDDIYDSLKQIAPVVFIDYYGTWQDQLKACAEIVGEDEKADEVIKDIENVVSDAKATISQSDKTLLMLRTNNGKAFTKNGNALFYEAFGIKYPDGLEFSAGESMVTLDLEYIADTMNPDYIIFQDVIATSEAFVADYQNNSVWNMINAVANQDVYYFEDSMNSFGPLAYKLLAAKLLEIYGSE